MDAKPSSSSPGSGPGQESEVERYGPLELRRLRKEDGRQLIAYTRVEQTPPSDPGAAGGAEEK
jgi:hypothetical protein